MIRGTRNANIANIRPHAFLGSTLVLQVPKSSALMLVALWGLAPDRAMAADNRALEILKAQIARQDAQIAAQQRQLAAQQQALDRLAARLNNDPASEKSVKAGKQAAPSSSKAAVRGIATEAPRKSRAPITPPDRVAGPDPRPGGQVLVSNPDFSLTVGGNLKVIAAASPVRAYVPGAAFVLFPKDITGKENQFRLSGQYGSLNATVTGPMLGSFETGVFAAVGFTGGTLTSNAYGVTPINLFGYLRSPEWTISAGLQNDVFAPRIPGMIDQTSALATQRSVVLETLRLSRYDERMRELLHPRQIAFLTRLVTGSRGAKRAALLGEAHMDFALGHGIMIPCDLLPKLWQLPFDCMTVPRSRPIRSRHVV